MPLMHGKSKAAFSHNVKAEMDAGKPQKQAVAIAYSEKRKMAEGGEAEPDLMDHVCDELWTAFEKKDKGLFRDALKALVLDIQDQDQEQDEEMSK